MRKAVEDFSTAYIRSINWNLSVNLIEVVALLRYEQLHDHH